LYVLGLRGRKGSGKDYTFKEILSPLYGARRYAFADELKRQVMETYGLTEQQLNDPERKDLPLVNYPVNPKDPLAVIICDFFKERKSFELLGFIEHWTPRLIMIAEGQFKRSIDPYYWVRFVEKKIAAEKPEFAVITDVRMPETEGLMIQGSFGGKVINIVRPGIGMINDPSETMMDEWPHFNGVLDNSGQTSAGLQQQLEFLFEQWGWTEFSPTLFKNYPAKC
jgi:hypothetical protein